MSIASEGVDAGFANRDCSTWFRTTLAPYMVHAAASFACVLVFIWTLHYHGKVGFSGNEVFNFHPLLQTIAFVLLIPESILLLRFSGFKRTVSKPFHASLHGVAVLLALLGVSAAYKYKKDEGGAQFRSLHSWLGIATVLLLLGQWSFGAFLFYRARGSFRSAMAPVHVHTGHAIVFTSACALLTGIMERTVSAGACLSSLHGECAVANSAGILIIVTFIALGIALSAVKRTENARNTADEPLLANDVIIVA